MSNNEFLELRQQVENLEKEVESLKNNQITGQVAEDVENQENVEVSENIDTENLTEFTENSELTAYLEEQLKSNKPDAWLEVAKCNLATEKQLEEVAKKCAALDYYTTHSADENKQLEILNALSENPATTDAIMKELVKSRFPNVWKAVASSSKSGENALKEVAKKCAELDYYTTHSADEDKQLEIANALSENSATTKAVMMELSKSRFASVISIGHQHIENNP